MDKKPQSAASVLLCKHRGFFRVAFATVVPTTFDDNDLSTVKSRLLSSRSPRVPPACQRR
jgi:hypothetical protein